MTISDQSRHLLHQHLDDVLGSEDAATLMAHLPPVGWADVATKRDLDHFALSLRAEMAAGFAGVRSDLTGEITGLRGDMSKEIGGLRGDVSKEIGELRGDMSRQMPTLLVGLLGLQISGAAIVLAVSRLL